MPSREKKNLEYERRKRWREMQKREWQAELAARPLAPDTFAELVRFIETRSGTDGDYLACDDHGHQFRLVLDFLREKNLNPDPILQWFRDYDAFCDHLVVSLRGEWGPYGYEFEHRYV